jgi:hypothetical protein
MALQTVHFYNCVGYDLLSKLEFSWRSKRNAQNVTLSVCGLKQRPGIFTEFSVEAALKLFVIRHGANLAIKQKVRFVSAVKIRPHYRIIDIFAFTEHLAFPFFAENQRQ